MTRRLAGLAIVSIAVSMSVVTGAAPAVASISTISAAQLANTTTAGAETITSSTPSAALTSPVVQVQGPGALTDADDTYDGASPVVTGSQCLPAIPPLPAVCPGPSTIATTVNLDPGGLPAGPGTYTLDVCAATCAAGSLTGDTSTLTVTGPAPVPGTVATPTAIAQGATATITMPGTGFAKDESLSLSRPGAAASDLTFVEDNTTSKATSLSGALTVGASVPAAVYDVVVTDTAGHTGVCTACLSVTAANSNGPGPVTKLTATALTATAASASWTAPTKATNPTYKVVVSKTSSTTSDSGVTATVNGTKAAVSGLSAATSYFVSVTAKDATGTSAPTETTVVTPYKTVLTLTASTRHVVDGKSVTLKGVLTRTTKTGTAPVAGKTVYLAARHDSGKGSQLTMVTTSADGGYSYSLAPAANAAYGAYFAGAPAAGSTPGDSAVFSAATPRVTVAPIVTAKAKKATTSHTAKLVVTGKVKPHEAGRAVHLLEVAANGHTRRLATVDLSSTSHFRFSVTKPAKRGRYHLEVSVGSGPGNTAGVSKKFTIRRT